jgi:hypothetical protein
VLQGHGDIWRHRFPGEPLEGSGIPVDTEEHAARSNPLEQGARVATAAEGGVDERLPGGWSKAAYDVL